MIKLGLIFLVLFKKCIGFDLDDVTYDRMPPLFSLDDYDRCLLYNGTYCVIRTDLFAEPGNELMSLMINFTKSSHIKHYDHTYQNKGLCLTTVCKQFIGNKNLNSRSDLHEILEKCENHTIFNAYGLQAKVADDFYCDTKETRHDKKELLDWLVLAVFVFIVLLNVSATLYDWMLNDVSKQGLSIGEKMILCFSLTRNWNFLFAPPSTDPKLTNLQGISCIRTIGSFIMVMGHVVWIFTMGFIDNPHDFERSYELPHFQLIYNGMIVVQLFFVLSGFLLIYNLETAAEDSRISWKILPVVALHRFWRLAPPLSLLMAFSATWLRFLGSGPLWKRYVFPVVNDCRRYWWSHLLFINNYVTDNMYCAVQTWHTAADTQIFFVGITMYLLTKPRHRGLVAGLSLLVGILLPALHVYFGDLDAQLLKAPEFLRSLMVPDRFVYVYGHNNIVCFLLGMVVAYKLYHWQKQGVVINTKISRLLPHVFVPAFFLCFFLGNLFHEEDYRSPLWVRMLWQGTHRLLLGTTIVILVIVVITKKDSVIARITEWPVFHVTGKITYSVFLLHMTFTQLVAGSKTNLEHFAYLNLIIYQCGIFVLTFIISIPFYLMVEAPSTPLLKLILTRSTSAEKSTMMPDPTKNFVAEIIKTKRNRVRVDRTDDKIKENIEEVDNEINSLLEDGAKECSNEKPKSS